jgi:hypothetical protein
MMRREQVALDNRDISGQDTVISSAVSDSGKRAWWWEPEPVRLAHAPVERFAPTRFDVITASFQFPCALVDARAQALVEGARRDGERHSLSLWRTGLRESLEHISREAAHTPTGAICAALFWDRVGDAYRVAVTFEAPQHTANGRMRH